MLWDVFCRLVDNYGDVGVCWRLACGLAQRGQRVRLWIDDAGPLAWMAPAGCLGVEVRGWSDPPDSEGPGEVVVEAFGGGLPEGWIDALAQAGRAGGPRRSWINLEHLSAEPYVERSHGLASPVHGGAPAGIHRWFYFPGFTARTGGLLREPDLIERRERFERRAWLAHQGIDWQGEPLVSLFCYEPPALEAWLDALARSPTPTRLLVTHGRAQAAVRAWLARSGAIGALRVDWLPALTQADFDHLLWSCDLNMVRGEDSLVRAIWAGAAFVWQAYPQDDGAHRAKLEALLDVLQAPASLREFHRGWNGGSGTPLPAPELGPWAAACAGARARLLSGADLVTQLLRFVAKNR